MEVTEALVAQMRTMRLDDPDMYQAVMALVSRVVERRVEKKSPNDLTGDDG